MNEGERNQSAAQLLHGGSTYLYATNATPTSHKVQNFGAGQCNV